MNRTGVVGALAAALLGTLANACEDPPREVEIEDAADAITDVYCGRMFDCSCDGRRFDSASACEMDVTQRVATLRQAGEEAGLLYDPRCLGEFLDTIDEAGCGPQLYDFSECRPPCNPYYGSQRVDQACEYFSSGLHDCDKGLECIAGVCQAPCGGSGASEGDSCLERSCADGLYCNENQICFALPTAGQPCPFSDCAEGSFCEAVDPVNNPGIRECFPLGANGDACRGHVQCESSHCPVGTCAPMPQRGDECPADVCAPGLSCVEGTCEDGEPAICYAGTPI